MNDIANLLGTKDKKEQAKRIENLQQALSIQPVDLIVRFDPRVKQIVDMAAIGGQWKPTKSGLSSTPHWKTLRQLELKAATELSASKDRRRMKGKGVYIWKPANIGTPEEVVECWWLPGPTSWPSRSTTPAMSIRTWRSTSMPIRAAGIKVIGWGYVYLKWNVLAELKGAKAAIHRYKPTIPDRCGGPGPEPVRRRPDLLKGFTAGVPETEDWAELLLEAQLPPALAVVPVPAGVQLRCAAGVLAGLKVLEKLADSKKEYARLTPKLPFSLPAGDMYIDRNLKPTPVEVLQFLNACFADPEIEGAVMWSMDQKNKVPELWDAYSRFDWDTGLIDGTPVAIPPAETLPLNVAVVTASRGLNVRRNPNTGNVPLRALRMGECVDVYGVENGWAWIKDDRTEWVYALYLKRI